MSKATQTRVTNKLPLPLDTRRTQSSRQWFLEAKEDAHSPVFHHNTLRCFIAGEEAFRHIAASIQRARKSIEIVCWGFDPAMELVRDPSHHWPRGDTWASLLHGAAVGRWSDGQPVQVRILSWFDALGEMAVSNMPGYVDAPMTPLSAAQQARLAALLEPVRTPGAAAATLSTAEKRQRREEANRLWYTLAKSGQLDNLSLRVRHGDAPAIQRLLSAQSMQLTLAERLGMERLGTYHQKTILIDYDDTRDSARPRGYVMGLNSVTDYWDTRAHLHTDPRRGEGWEGAVPDAAPNLKPYQDYACLIEGQALMMVSKNFTEAWNAASGPPKGKGRDLVRSHALNAPPPHLTHHLSGPRQSAQILRTQPARDGGENSIERLYHHVAGSARHYLYIENQYFQHAGWVNHLKHQRKAYVAMHRKVGSQAADIPHLHLMVVTPTPERKQMVPRTHDALKELGHGNSMPRQSDMLDAEIKRYKQDKARHEQMREQLQTLNPQGTPPYVLPPEPQLSDVARTYLEAGGDQQDQDIRFALQDEMGLRTLVASLWTFDANYIETQREGRAQLRDLERQQKGSASAKALRDRLRDQRYREIYIHSKLMIADDSVFTLGSANLNVRSFAADGELNVVSDCPDTSERLRRQVWAMHSGGAEFCEGGTARFADMTKAFDRWQRLIDANGKAKIDGKPITGFLVPMLDERTSRFRLG
ncbi:MAG: phospholipase [Hydrogenophaga sp.]|uniref:phospholipase D-like domain-containing protein n=1 Tax=Hydrogenophaga sp. TaxID=1904254 RepID=UPI0025B91ED9|nr:phospholipase D-like domain-containing protein [Hydrogenophaga sp.]MBU7572504.1 phospholipase [Hydrogenophaga sp.]